METTHFKRGFPNTSYFVERTLPSDPLCLWKCFLSIKCQHSTVISDLKDNASPMFIVCSCRVSVCFGIINFGHWDRWRMISWARNWRYLHTLSNIWYTIWINYLMRILGLFLIDGLCVKAFCWDWTVVYSNLQWPNYVIETSCLNPVQHSSLDGVRRCCAIGG